MFEFRGVTFGYPGRETVLKELSFRIDEGEFVCIIGKNGSGKSTIARLMNGLLRPSSGSVGYAGLTTENKKDLPVIRRKIGMVFQNPESQMIAPTVFEEVAFGLQHLGLPLHEIHKRVEQALQQTGMAELLHADVESLSAGQQQRLAIADALAMEPEVLVLDEATSMLDPEGKEQVMELVGRLHRQGMTIVTVTHDMEELPRDSRVLVIDQGRIQYDGSPPELYARGYPGIRDLGIPFAVEASELLKQRGIDLPPAIYGMEELVDALCK